MKDILCIFGFILALWLIIYTILEFRIMQKHKENVENSFSELDKIFIKRLSVLYRMMDIIKEYNKIDFEALSSDLYDYMQSYNDYTTNERIAINEHLALEVKKVLLVSAAYPELQNHIKYPKYEKQLKRYNKVITKCSIKYNNTLIAYKERKKIFPSKIICKLGKYPEYQLFTLN